MISHEEKVKNINAEVQTIKTQHTVAYTEENKFGSQHMENVVRQRVEYKFKDMQLMEDYMLGQDMLQEKLEATEEKSAEATSITANPQYRNATKKSEERKTYNKASKEAQLANQAKQSFTKAIEKSKELENLKKPAAAEGELTKEERKAERARISKIEEVLQYRTEGQIHNIEYKASKNGYDKKELDFRIKKARISSLLFLKKEIENSLLPETEKKAKMDDLDKQMKSLNSFKWEQEQAKAKEKEEKANLKAAQKEEQARLKAAQKEEKEKEKANKPKSKMRIGRWAYEIGRIFTLNYGIVGGIIADHCLNTLDKIEGIHNEFEEGLAESQMSQLESEVSEFAATQQNKEKTGLDSFIQFNQNVQQYVTLQKVPWNSIGKGILKGLKWFGLGIGYGLLGATAPIWGVPYLAHKAVSTAKKIKAGPEIPDFMENSVYENVEDNAQQGI